MRTTLFRFHTILVMASSLALCACLSTGEVIEVEKPPVTQTVYDITSGRMAADERGVVTAMSSSNVEVYGLNGPAAVVDDGGMARDAGGMRAYSTSSQVTVYPFDPEELGDPTDYIGTKENARRGAPVGRVDRNDLIIK